jgi:hypothetical protein
MLELAPGDDGMRPLADVAERKPPPAWPEMQVLADQTTRHGEIIDPKCYLGAMKPGGAKTHKGCAMLCISGGVPPMLVTRDAAGEETFILLTTADVAPANDLVLPFVGDRVAVTGRLERHGDLLFLRTAADGISRR